MHGITFFRPMILLILIVLVSWSSCQLAPQFSVSNPILGSITSYKMSYYSSNNLTTSTTFNVNLNQSNLRIADGPNNCTIRIGSTTAVSPICSCTNRICTFRPMTVSDPKPVEIEISNITNPMFIFQQVISVMVYFSPTVSYNYNVIIPPNNYQTMTMHINSIKQSDYGVGYTPVSYSFNISLLYISRNMQMQITIPPEITISSISSDLSFYSTIQNVVPLQVQSLLIYSLQIETNTNPVGFMLLNLSGLGNPRYLGNSSSFKITFVQTSAIANCATCKIAEVTTGLPIESRVPGDVIAVTIYSTNQFISAVNTLSINLQLYAGIPQGGKISIYLPPEIRPTEPIECGNIYGFIFPDNNNPTCSYNSTANRVDTVNFATPYFDSTGNGIISLKVTNPQDSRKVNFTFETYDSSGRMIGQSRSSSFYTATPLPMNAVINKTAQEVDKPFNMSCEISITQSLNLTNYVEVTLPSVVYDLPNIHCFSAGQNLSCTKSYDIMQQLVITFAPPCVQCTTGNTLKFTIVNLKNPSYINDANQQIIVNTRSIQGVIESGIKSLTLTPSAITLSSYSKPTSQVVGTEYNLQMTLGLPDYVKLNGGQIHLQFSPMSAYSDGQLSGFSYTGPSYSLEIITNLSSTILSNSVQYYPDSSPDTISKIIFNICDGVVSVCNMTTTSFTFVIRKLKIGYIPSLQSTDVIRIATKYGQIISEKTLDTSSFSPIIQTGQLNISVTRSITNSLSDFQFTFLSNKVVFDKVITFTLPSSLVINGQCSLSSTQGFVNSFVCTKTSNNSISISGDFDQDLMISQSISFSITITNVSTSVSMAPLNYILETTYNGTKNQRFSVRYSMLAPLPLNITYVKSNYTINQQFKLSLSVIPATTQYDSHQVILPKTTVLTQQDWLSGFTLTQNQTHYILDRAGMIPNNYTEIRCKNSLSTYDQPQYVVNLLQGGFLVQQAVIVLTYNAPVVLGCAVTLSNRTVGATASMTITCDRNSNGELLDQTLIARLPANSFGFSTATANSVAISTSTPTASLTITSTTPRVISLSVSSLKNLLYIPNLASQNFASNIINSLEIVSVQDNNSTKIVGRCVINPADFVPNDASDLVSVTATRNNVKSGENTNITINYGTLYGTIQHIMRIGLPGGQNGFITSSGCLTGSTLDQCSIIESNSSEMKLSLKPNSTVTLTNVLNNYPNPNKLAVQILTYPELQQVEQSYISITPPITLEPLNVIGKATSPKVGDINTITLELRPTQLKIEAANVIKIAVPAKMFTRTFNNDDCSIRNLAITTVFTGCTYEYDTNGWLTMIKLGAFGPVDVDIGGLLTVNFTVTNAWTSYPFTTKGFIVTVYKNQTSGTSQGISFLTSIYQNLNSFSLLQISQSSSTFSQSSLQASSTNILSTAFSLLGNIGNTTKIMCLIPKDSYIFTAPSNSVQVLEREDPSYYYVSIPTTCTSNGCQSYSQQLSIQVQNNYFVKKQKNNVIFYAIYDGLTVSQSYVISTDNQTPLSVPSLLLNRTSSIGGESTTVSLRFSLLPFAGSTTTFGLVTVDISSNITNPRVQNTVFSYGQIDSSNQVAQVTGIIFVRTGQNITVSIPSGSSSSSLIQKIDISGKNALQVPIGPQQYWIVVQNSTHILYCSWNIAFASKLVPMSQGLTLVRANTTVGATSQLKLQGNLPQDEIINMSQYPLMINSQTYGAIPQSNIDYAISSYSNPLTISNEQSLIVSLCNSTYCIYRQASSPVTPPLTPIYFSSNDVTITVPISMNISSNYLLQVNFTRPIVNKTFVNINVDDRLFSTVVAVGGYAFNDSTQRTDAITDLAFTVTPSNQNGVTKKILTIRSRTLGKAINISSLEVTVRSPNYQISLPNSQVKLTFESPTTVFTKSFDFSITGTTLNSRLTLTSNKTNQISNYTLTVQPLLRAGVLSIEIPSYISAIYNGNTPNTFSDDTMHTILKIQINGTQMAVTGTNEDRVGSLAGLYLLTYRNITKTFLLNLVFNGLEAHSVKISLNNITNPPDNRVLYFTVYQHELELLPTQIYGYRQLAYKMTILNPIYVYSGVRNITKIGAKISLNLDIETQAGVPDQMVLKLSQMQVLVKQGADYPCSFCIDGQNCISTGITSVQADNVIKIAQHTPGRHNYTISGCLINSLFSQEPQVGDEIYAGLSMPYQTAETTQSTSTYITPLVSTGEIQLLEMSSSSNKRAHYTTLKLSIKPQNYANCDGIHLRFDPLAYFVHANIKCFINNQEASHFVINSSSLFIQVGQKTAIFSVEIKNLINYIENKGFVISSMKKKAANTASNPTNGALAAQMTNFNAGEFGIADQITITSSPNTFIAYDAQTRLIFPDNYVSGSEKQIIAINDYTLPSQLPTLTLRYSFSSGEIGCSQNLAFNKTISMACLIDTSGVVNFNVKLYDTKLASSSLTSFTKSLFIYPRPKDTCSNVRCDVCSTEQNGQQYCFTCREGLYSNGGQCTDDCPAQTFPYMGRTCTQCSPQCQECFDLYDNSCLSCRNTALVLDSGICRNYCSDGYAFQAKFCVNNDECTSEPGCRLCSSTGFCYQCLPDFEGEPTCKYAQILPRQFFVFWMIPFLLLIPIVAVITCCKVGRVTFSHMFIYLLSVVELMSWIFVIPKLPVQALAMIMCAFLLLKIIISIIAYQTYYNKQITLGKQQKLLGDHERESESKTDHGQANSKKSKQMVKNEDNLDEEPITQKERLARFSAHFLSCDAYELLMNKWGKPHLNIKHHMPYFVLTILDRIIVIGFLGYVLSQYSSPIGDLLYLPLIGILSGLGILLTRLITSEKAAACLSRIRG